MNLPTAIYRTECPWFWNSKQGQTWLVLVWETNTELCMCVGCVYILIHAYTHTHTQIELTKMMLYNVFLAYFLNLLYTKYLHMLNIDVNFNWWNISSMWIYCNLFNLFSVVGLLRFLFQFVIKNNTVLTILVHVFLHICSVIFLG